MTEIAPQSNSRLMKIWVKFVYGCIKLPTPLLQNPGYTTAIHVSQVFYLRQKYHINKKKFALEQTDQHQLQQAFAEKQINQQMELTNLVEADVRY